MHDIEKFGLLIQNIRKSKKITQEQVSNKTGLDRTYISLIETGKRNPSLSSIIKLSKALEIGLSELFFEYEKILNIDSEVV